MATDPVKQIETREYQTGFIADPRDLLRRLAELPPSIEAPYVTLGLDWRPDGTAPNRRPGRQAFDQQAEALLTHYQEHTPAYASIDPDVERMRSYLDDALTTTAQGVYVVACHAQGVFEPVPLGLPLPNRLVVGPTPALLALARLAEDNPTYAVLLADQRDAILSLINQARREQSVDVEATGYPVHQKQGGWSQARYQRRANERVNAFARTVADETRRTLDETRVGMLVVAGDEEIVTALNEAFHQTVKDRIVGTIHLQIEATLQDVIVATRPVIERVEREREAAAVRNVGDQVGSSAAGTAGAEAVLTALQARQVMTLVMNDDFTAPGWADYSMPLYGVGRPPSEHPAGGDAGAIVPVALEEELVRLAIQNDAEIEIVRTAVPVGAEEQAQIRDAAAALPRSPAALALDALGGVGTVLRFALNVDQPTANL